MVPGGAGKVVQGAIGALGAGAGLAGGNAGGLWALVAGDTSGGGPSPWELYGVPATKASGEIQAAATDKQTQQIKQSYADLITGNQADTAALNQQAETGVKQNINAATIEPGNYQNLVLRARLTLFGIVLVAFAVWRFVAQPAMHRRGGELSRTHRLLRSILGRSPRS